MGEDSGHQVLHISGALHIQAFCPSCCEWSALCDRNSLAHACLSGLPVRCALQCPCCPPPRRCGPHGTPEEAVSGGSGGGEVASRTEEAAPTLGQGNRQIRSKPKKSARPFWVHKLLFNLWTLPQFDVPGFSTGLRGILRTAAVDDPEISAVLRTVSRALEVQDLGMELAPRG